MGPIIGAKFFPQASAGDATIEALIGLPGLAFSYNLENALFGGSTPLVVTLLTEK